uniref:Uncharacterized protein n=1 Tax=Schistocephalus solidus TaxID=70667 RepID=A0A0X3NGE6_SCHSO
MAFVSNEAVRSRCDNTKRIFQTIQERRLKGFGHVCLRPPFKLSYTALDPSPLPTWRLLRGHLKTGLHMVRRGMGVVLGPPVFGLGRWRCKWAKLSSSAAADRRAWRDTIHDLIGAG